MAMDPQGRRGGRTAGVAPAGGLLGGTILASCLLAGCGGSDDDAEGPTIEVVGEQPEVQAPRRPLTKEEIEEAERRARNAAAAERQRLELITELERFVRDRDTTASDLMMLVPPDPPRLFELDESQLEALPAADRTATVARYDRVAQGLKALAERAVAEAAGLVMDGRAGDARTLLEQVRGLAEASSGDLVAEIGRNAARAVMAAVDAALTGTPEG